MASACEALDAEPKPVPELFGILGRDDSRLCKRTSKTACLLCVANECERSLWPTGWGSNDRWLRASKAVAGAETSKQSHWHISVGARPYLMFFAAGITGDHLMQCYFRNYGVESKV